MSTTTAPARDPFAWEVQPSAAYWVAEAIDDFVERSEIVKRLARVLYDETGTRLVDWIDYLAFDDVADEKFTRGLMQVGYMASLEGDRTVWRHPRGMFPQVLVGTGPVGLAIRAESVAACVAELAPKLGVAKQVREITGASGGTFRRVQLSDKGGIALWAVERHGYQGFAAPHEDAKKIDAAERHLETFRARRRQFDDSSDGFRYTSQLFSAAAKELGRAWACDLFFQAEREYWQGRNRAAEVQYERQNRLGLGWANHDHHTYRSSRAAFRGLIALLEQMGFECRERFYAGREAGWGAQVIEQPECRVVIFADVDLSPEEVTGDFAHEPLAARDTLGTVGLWCELHGEAFFDAGMHHLECQFDFDAAREQLAALGVETMAPFTDFPHLKQAFTRGEIWQIDPRRIERLLSQGRITGEQADRFRREGALGSHMEILERNDGYKGFNQTGISEIITRTDPRRIIGA